MHVVTLARPFEPDGLPRRLPIGPGGTAVGVCPQGLYAPGAIGTSAQPSRWTACTYLFVLVGDLRSKLFDRCCLPPAFGAVDEPLSRGRVVDPLDDDTHR